MAVKANLTGCLVFSVTYLISTNCYSEDSLEKSIRGVPIQDLISPERDVRHEAVTRLIEAAGGIVNQAEKARWDGNWEPTEKIREIIRWNWDWQPLQLNAEETAALLELCKSVTIPTPSPNLSKDELRKFQRSTSTLRRQQREIRAALGARILARIPDKQVTAYLLDNLDTFSIGWMARSNLLPIEYRFASELHGRLYMTGLNLEVTPELLGENPVAYAIALSEAVSLNDILTIIGDQAGTYSSKWRQLPEEDVDRVLACLAACKLQATKLRLEKSGESYDPGEALTRIEVDPSSTYAGPRREHTKIGGESACGRRYRFTDDREIG